MNLKSFSKSFFEDHIKKYKLVFFCSFSVGILISATPYIYKVIKNYKLTQEIKKEKLLQIEKLEKKCKDSNSDYSKYLILGFPKTAISKFDICMKEK